jgi:signal transduction histidine kinase
MKEAKGNSVSKEQFLALQSQLLASEERYAKLFDHLSDEVHYWKVKRDEKGAITTWELVDVNPAALKSWGRKKEEVLGKSVNEIFGFDATNQFIPVVNELFSSGEVQKWVAFFEPTNQYLSMSSIAFGEFFISTGEDITAKMESDIALSNSEMKYRNIAGNMPGVVFRYQMYRDGSDSLLYVSEGVNDLFEISKENALENTALLLNLIHKEDLSALLKTIEDSLKSLAIWEHEYRIHFPDGRIKWVWMKGIPMKQEDGSFIWDAFAFDISESIKNRKELEKLNNELEKRVADRTQELLKTSEELELYRMAAEHSESGVFFYDLRKNELTWDKVMYKLFDVKKEDFSGAYEAWESSLHPDDKERSVQELNDAIMGVKPFDTVFRIIHSSTGKVLHIRGKGKVERDEHGEAVAVFGTNWDVSREMNLSIEKEEVLNNLKETQTQLVQSEKMASLGVLTSGIAHEINNPLNYILGGYTVINNRLKEDGIIEKEELSEYLGWIKTGAERAADIVKSLNSLSRSTTTANEACDVHLIIEDCLHVLRHKYASEIEIVKDLSPTEQIIIGNNGKLHQVILNVLSNAIDSIANKGVIEIHTKGSEEEVNIIIKDSGCGIANENLKKITDPFFTTKEPGKGTGLGLSISKKIINEHSGELSFDSKPNEGTSVLIKLPKNN